MFEINWKNANWLVTNLNMSVDEPTRVVSPVGGVLFSAVGVV